MNFSEEEKKSWTGKVRPSCAVKPMIKAPKPSATVKPFLKSEGLVEDESLEKGEAKIVAGSGSVITNGQVHQPECQPFYEALSYQLLSFRHYKKEG